MPCYDVFLVPCVTVKVPRINALTMVEAVKQAETSAKLAQLFTPVNRVLPPGVAWVEWSEECSHYLVDELPQEGDDPLDSQFLNTEYEPVIYDHTTGMLLQLLDASQVRHEFGVYRRITMEAGCLRCTSWRQSDAAPSFLLTDGGIVYHNRVYAHWEVVSIEIPDHVGLPLRLLEGAPDDNSNKEDDL